MHQHDGTAAGRRRAQLLSGYEDGGSSLLTPGRDAIQPLCVVECVVGGGLVIRGIAEGFGALFGLGASSQAGLVSVEFGANANQISHAFRHIDAIGISRDAVTTAIRADMPALQVGQGITRSVTVNGVDLTYRAHRATDSLVNVGRITPPRP